MAKFSRKHYQDVARIVKNIRPLDQLLDVAGAFVTLFEADNNRFDREHFLAVVRGERAVNSRPPKK
jgi:hypothetical protein